MAQLSLKNVGKRYPDGFVAVKDFNLEAADGEFVVLVGPSGCGKSTTLRLIAGLEEDFTGTITIGDRVVNDVHPKDRDIAMVFQNYALYPHMSVYKNMAFALKLRKVPKAEIDRRVREAARILNIETLLERKPGQLSGGQRQRVALGRAIVREPKAFLFDEPLSNLDAKLRVSTRAELKALHLRLRTTTIYVTHDQEEAMTLGDRIVVMAAGLIQQVAPPLTVYRKPVNRFVASFVGMPPMNFLSGRLSREGEALVFAEGSNDPSGRPYTLRMPGRFGAALGAWAGKDVVVGVRPQALSEARPGREDDGLTMTMPVKVVEPLGDTMDVFCSTPGHPQIVARVGAREGIAPGSVVTLALHPDGMHVFEPGEFGRNLTA